MARKDALVEVLETMRANLGESVHVSWRKGTDWEGSHDIWMRIRDMPRDEWGGYLAFVWYCMDGDRALRLAKRRSRAKLTRTNN